MSLQLYNMILQLYTLLTSNVLLFNEGISLNYGLPNDLSKMRFVDCKFLKPNYISHIRKCFSFSANKAYEGLLYEYQNFVALSACRPEDCTCRLTTY